MSPELKSDPRVLNLYLDDSGTRHPARDPGRKPEHGYDWFALGGVIVDTVDEDDARNLHQDFLSRWNIETPLHSSEIRSKNENFQWLRGLCADEQKRFYEELYCLMRDMPVVGIACVIDRPGYNSRYFEKFRQNPWMLCKTAFSVVVERSLKFAKTRKKRLRVFSERCNKKEDALMKSYFESLKSDGLPFDRENSEKYTPLENADFRELLFDFKTKQKSSPMCQVADLFLWPMCMGGYHASNRPYARLMGDKKLIECHIAEADWPVLASKYSCFELVKRKP